MVTLLERNQRALLKHSARIAELESSLINLDSDVSAIESAETTRTHHVQLLRILYIAQQTEKEHLKSLKHLKDELTAQSAAYKSLQQKAEESTLLINKLRTDLAHSQTECQQFAAKIAELESKTAANGNIDNSSLIEELQLQTTQNEKKNIEIESLKQELTRVKTLLEKSKPSALAHTAKTSRPALATPIKDSASVTTIGMKRKAQDEPGGHGTSGALPQSTIFTPQQPAKRARRNSPMKEESPIALSPFVKVRSVLNRMKNAGGVSTDAENGTENGTEAGGAAENATDIPMEGTILPQTPNHSQPQKFTTESIIPDSDSATNPATGQPQTSEPSADPLKTPKTVNTRGVEFAIPATMSRVLSPTISSLNKTRGRILATSTPAVPSKLSQSFNSPRSTKRSTRSKTIPALVMKPASELATKHNFAKKAKSLFDVSDDEDSFRPTVITDKKNAGKKKVGGITSSDMMFSAMGSESLTPTGKLMQLNIGGKSKFREISPVKQRNEARRHLFKF